MPFRILLTYHRGSQVTVLLYVSKVMGDAASAAPTQMAVDAAQATGTTAMLADLSLDGTVIGHGALPVSPATRPLPLALFVAYATL